MSTLEFPYTVLIRLQTKWDPDNLHRHPDYASVKKENTDSIRQPSDYISADKGNTVVGNEQKAIDDSDPSKCNHTIL